MLTGSNQQMLQIQYFFFSFIVIMQCTSSTNNVSYIFRFGPCGLGYLLHHI